MQEFPQDFEKRVRNDSFLGEDLLQALNTEPPTSIRLHPKKGKDLFSTSKEIPWSPWGRWLLERPIFTLDPCFHGGAYYPQEAGSQFLASILPQLEIPEHPVILDLCAAPGGKSTLILDYLDGKGFLVSNEIIPNRAKILKENLIKWGASNNVVINNSPADIRKSTIEFDCIVIDAPCSGEGMFRKDLQARNEWSSDNVIMCASRQKDILEDVWGNLKPGGFLIYSTCTFNEDENEKNTAWMLEEFNAQLVSIQAPNAIVDRNKTGYYALPHLLDTEGFYFTVLQKPYESSSQGKHSKKFKSKLAISKETQAWEKYIDIHSTSIIEWQNYQFVVPKPFESLVFQIHDELRVIKLGTELGEKQGKDVIPHISLALDEASIALANPPISLNKTEALKYLKGETFPLSGEKGYQIVAHQGVHLGWIKHLGNRFNNLYPKEWRIRMRID